MYDYFVNWTNSLKLYDKNRIAISFHQMKIMIYFTLLLFISFPKISCNIWDNIFSNLRSPENSLPEEFCVEIYDRNNDKLKLGEIWASTMNNKMKITLYNTINEIDIFNETKNTSQDKFLSDSLKTYGLLNLFKNFTLNSNENKSENISKNNNLLSVIIDFNKDSSVTYLSQDFCQIQKNKKLNRLSVKLILVSYDLFTYFEENYDNENVYDKENISTKTYEEKVIYDDYIFTNIPINFENDYNNFLTDKSLKNFYPLFEVLFKNKIKNFSKDNKNMQNLVDKKALIVFRVNKQTQKLQEIKLKYENVVFYSMTTRIKTFDSIDDKIFNPIELKDEGALCEIIKEGDVREKSISQFVMESFMKMKK